MRKAYAKLRLYNAHEDTEHLVQYHFILVLWYRTSAYPVCVCVCVCVCVIQDYVKNARMRRLFLAFVVRIYAIVPIFHVHCILISIYALSLSNIQRLRAVSVIPIFMRVFFCL